MGKIKLTKQSVERIQPPKSGKRAVADSETSGLNVMVWATGGKVFYWIGRSLGRVRNIKLGKFPQMTVDQARTMAKRINLEVAEGKAPEAGMRDVPTVAELFEHYLEHHAQLKKKPSSITQDQWFWEKTLATALGRRKAREVTTAEVREIQSSVASLRGKVSSNRAITLLKSIYNHGRRWELVDRNPAEGVEKFGETSRERFLQPSELQRFFSALDGLPQAQQDIILLLLYTGARRGNVCAMRWENLLLDESVWSLPESKTGKQRIPLVPPAMAILRRRYENRSESPWVFPSRSRAGHITDVRRSWESICTKAELSDLVPHDLRRSLGSWMAAAGTSDLVIGKALGHAPGSKATPIYSRLTLDPIRAAVESATAAIIAASQVNGGKQSSE